MLFRLTIHTMAGSRGEGVPIVLITSGAPACDAYLGTRLVVFGYLREKPLWSTNNTVLIKQQNNQKSVCPEA